MKTYLRPIKIDWLFPATVENWVENIKSKSTRKIALKLDSILDETQLTNTFSPLDASSYENWLHYYSEKMTEQNHDIIATNDWFMKKKSEVKNLFIANIYKEDKRVGSSIISEKEDGVFTEHFKATDRLDINNMKNVSLGTLLELIVIRESFNHGAKLFSSGRSRNGFGYFNTLGYLAFKLKMGYLPSMPVEIEMDTFFEHQLDQPCVWFVVEQNHSVLHVKFYQKEKVPLEILNLLQTFPEAETYA